MTVSAPQGPPADRAGPGEDVQDLLAVFRQLVPVGAVHLGQNFGQGRGRLCANYGSSQPSLVLDMSEGGRGAHNWCFGVRALRSTAISHARKVGVRQLIRSAVSRETGRSP